MKILLCFAVIMLILGGVPVHAENDGHISAIRFHGVRGLAVPEIKKAMATKFPSWFSWLPWIRLPPFDEGKLTADLRSIEALYRSEGYFNAKAEYRLKKSGARKRVVVDISVFEDKPTRVENIFVILGSSAAITTEEILPKILLAEEKRFTVALYERSKEQIIAYLGNRGYPNASVHGKVTVDKGAYRADVLFNVVAGATRYFGPVALRGNTEVKSGYIIREVLFHQGDVFAWDLLYRSQRRIFRLDLFTTVLLMPRDLQREEFVPVDIEVEERKKRTLNMGVGYGNEEKFKTQILWTRRYFTERLITLNIALRYSSLLRSGTVDITKRYFIDHNSNLGIHAGYVQEIVTSYENERVYAQSRIVRVFGENIEGFVAYSLESNRPVNISPATLAELRETQPGGYYLISGLLSGIKWDSVGSDPDPRRGEIYSLFFEPATHLLGSRVDYVRSICEARIYRGVTRDVVLATRARLGGIAPYRVTRDIPIFKRFFLGGSDSVRGYGFQEIGPKNNIGQPIGGNYLVEGNLELRLSLFKNVGVVGFFDFGNVYLDSLDLYLPALRYGTGIGARYSTVLGPLRVDIAFPLEPFPAISLDRYKIYFSIGNAF